ncbi:protelomerase family protein, partial [Planktothrix sp.]|uniref:protelomerase family protein n=1 Tax=Planktothrix sp. TaxID=3088171 RepID=UPI0038D445B4
MATFNYKQDAVQLAKEVIRLYKEGKIEDAKNLCNDKILDLAKIYKPSTLCKGIQPTYRKAIFSESGLSEYRYTEYPVSLFSVPIEMIAATNETTRDTVEKQLNDYIFIKSESIDKMLKKAVELIKKDCISGQDYYDKAVGIALLTGRRIYSEVLLQADFEAINSNNNNISFTGQAKGGVEKALESYKIPVLGCD